MINRDAQIAEEMVFLPYCCQRKLNSERNSENGSDLTHKNSRTVKSIIVWRIPVERKAAVAMMALYLTKTGACFGTEIFWGAMTGLEAEIVIELQ
jgi:hypothetical protein